MFLKISKIAAYGFLLWLASAHAEQPDDVPAGSEVIFRHSTQLGYDYWGLGELTTGDRLNRLYLANSAPRWQYKSYSPWLNFNGQLRVNPSTFFTLKYRADQSTGSRLDELSGDFALSPSVGIRAGVVDYKVSWCRRYDIDSPWIRENDPFCTVKTTDKATSSAPGVQAYISRPLGSYQTQFLVGAYSPLIFAYDKKELTNTVVADYMTVKYNRKLGLAFNAVNVDTGTEFRFAWQGTNQGADALYPDDIGLLPEHLQQKVNLFYGGASFALTNRLSLRATYLNSKSKSWYTWLPPEPQIVTYSFYNNRASKVLELNYQFDPQNIFSAAVSEYQFNSGSRDHFDGFEETSKFKNDSYSLSWRREMGRNFFAVTQFTRAKTKQSEYSGPFVSRSGQALGVRLGYRF